VARAAPDAPPPSRWAARGVCGRLPQFPWDLLTDAKAKATEHPDGMVDLSVGTPVDDVPDVVQRALAEHSNTPGYPTTQGTPALRHAAADWLARRLGVVGVDVNDILPVIGTKELVAGLPLLLGVGVGDTIVVPELAYPTYDVGARISGARVVASDSLVALGPAPVAMIWLNSPSNPTGRVLPVEHLRKVVQWARQRGALVVSDECYVELGWDAQPVSVLHPDVCDGSHEGLLAVHSLSKRSNLAGYRAGFVVGDPAVVSPLLEARKHMGLMMPAPVQAAMTAGLADDTHVLEQRSRYLARRQLLIAALAAAGVRVDHSQAGLYLWVSRDEPCWETVEWFAGQGILVAPGDFYGPAGSHHVRIALTAPDVRVAAAAGRLAG
jgi:succinyldiaminopimelate transaminase